LEKEGKRMPLHNLLTENLISVRYEKGEKGKLSLPGVLAKLSREDIESFTALQPHQEQAWYCFLVQLAAMAMHESEAQSIEGDENEWTARLRSLTKDFPNDEPWSMVVEDLAKPAFMQTPVPEGNLDNYKKEATKPEDIDTVITSKNHDLKSGRFSKAETEHWIYSLITLQTTQGVLGRNNYGIVRMNGGLANRTMVGIASNETYYKRFNRDCEVLISNREKIAEDLYKLNNGFKLLWQLSWDGLQQLNLREMDPFFIEICRRIRFNNRIEYFFCKIGTSKAERIANDGIKGITGDPWTPIDKRDKKGEKSFSLSSSGYGYQLVRNLLWGDEFKKSLCLEPQKNETGDLLFIGKGMVRGQGITEGLYERKIPIPGRVRFFSEESNSKLASISKLMLNDLDVYEDKLSFSLRPLFENEYPKQPMIEFNSHIDAIYFCCLWDLFDVPEDNKRLYWHQKIETVGRTLLTKTINSRPLCSMKRYEIISKVLNRYEGSIKKIKQAMQGGIYA
jgi:CRISPR system Cascade subunit CasA